MVFKLGMTVDLYICMTHIIFLVSMTLTLMQGHSVSVKSKLSVAINYLDS